MHSSHADAQRPRRADARDNRERVLRAARAEFAEQGPDASLNKIAQRAGVGPGTLYRHFPNLQALLVALIGDDVDALCAQGRDLLQSASPDEALRTWLHAVARHATAMRGLVATQMIAQPSQETGTALAGYHEAILTTGAMLLTRAQHEGNAPAELDIADLLKLANAIAWASEQSSADPRLLDRLLALIHTGPPYFPPA
ncbi:TetR/AcrR family transcriptional regulator [Actinomadura sp. NAK00032]|uniref:TetR/AcrR family transcriptional regulator n=1 Tax=Actinomadura sp. NAK00032 TaxID=2742128 RepID=UPI001590016B|nr:TetR/AcrR family transcriptional regulator [Actinomadura sp. NAK00032]QKW35809.1 TetR/AcrR family transcriptional regulator [Actinomadura sp. NAK00032]